MKRLKIKGKELAQLGLEDEGAISLAKQILEKHYKRIRKEEALTLLQEVLQDPKNFRGDQQFGLLADKLLGTGKARKKQQKPNPSRQEILLREKPLPYPVYGKNEIEAGALDQMDKAMSLPISVKGALMPDAHQGYGLPIGGVLATRNAIIPYGVGMDIGCRVCMTVYPSPVNELEKNKERLVRVLEENTRFGRAEFNVPGDHPVLERKEFKEILILQSLQGKARAQLGTSGGGNHFVDLGILDIPGENPWGLKTGNYFAILSHSGSRGFGAEIARHYTQVAKEKCPLPKGAKQLSWLEMGSEEGQEYWAAMNLAGDYSSANHHIIHERLAKALGEQAFFMVENHHNYAWKTTLGNGEEVILHRKGATPAKQGDLAIIPGTMATPAHVVRGKGHEEALYSAAHGAGRLMSRGQAKENILEKDLQLLLKKQGVTLVGGGMDEAPMAYKKIEHVMQYQLEMVETLAKFYPRIVRMG